MKEVMIVVGAGQISMAIARRMGVGKKIILGDKNIEKDKNVKRQKYLKIFLLNINADIIIKLIVKIVYFDAEIRFSIASCCLTSLINGFVSDKSMLPFQESVNSSFQSSFTFSKASSKLKFSSLCTSEIWEIKWSFTSMRISIGSFFESR